MSEPRKVEPGLHECRNLVRTKYPNAYVAVRDHPKNRFRVYTGDRPGGKPNKPLASSWSNTDLGAWRKAFNRTLPKVLEQHAEEESRGEAADGE